MQRIRKNVAGQSITLLAVDANGVPKTGEAANITFHLEKDASASIADLADTSAAEVDATKMKGMYRCGLAQAETNADNLLFGGTCTTSGVLIVPAVVATEAATAGEIYEYLANGPWNLIAIWNKLLWGVPASELTDPTGLIAALRAAVVEVDAQKFHGMQLTGDGTELDPIRVLELP